jgi:hypothetical protein
MHINIQCLKNKCNELILFLRDNNNIDIITVNVHWLKPDELVYTHIHNFFIASSYCRPHTKHGGVLMLLKKGIKSVPRQDINKLSKEVDCYRI